METSKDGASDLDATAKTFNEAIQLKAQTKLKDSERLLRVKTIAYKGCIQLITEFHVHETAPPLDLVMTHGWHSMSGCV